MTNTSDLAGAVSGAGAPADVLTARYIKACDEYLSACRVLVEQLHSPAAAASNIALPSALFGQWQDFAKTLMLRSDGSTVGAWATETLLSPGMPKFGISREHQEAAQRIFDLSVQFQRSYGELLSLVAGASQDGLQTVRNRASTDASLRNSPRAAYDAWIDGAEAAYSQVAHSASFARLVTELCNVLSALKVERAKLFEYFAKQLDLPTRAEVDSLHRQMRELREQSRR